MQVGVFITVNTGLSLAQGGLKGAMGEIRASIFRKRNRKEGDHRRKASLD
jgi:hypothetical protein